MRIVLGIALAFAVSVSASCAGHSPKVDGNYSVSVSIRGAPYAETPFTLRSGGTGTDNTIDKFTWKRSGSRIVIVGTLRFVGVGVTHEGVVRIIPQSGSPLSVSLSGQINSSGLSSRASPGTIVFDGKNVGHWYAVRSN